MFSIHDMVIGALNCGNRGMAKSIVVGNNVSLPRYEYVVLDGDQFLKWSVRRPRGDWSDSETTRLFDFELVRALQMQIGSYADYRSLQQLS
jgi:hypothetical protein